MYRSFFVISYLCGMLDYIVVGLGLAGISFCETLRKNSKTFICYNDNSQQASLVAGGLYNPVILKRFTLSWKVTEQLEIANRFYREIEENLDISFDQELPVLRRFHGKEEQNLWFEAADKEYLKPYLSLTLVPNENTSINAALGYGRVLRTGRIDTKTFIEGYTKYLLNKDLIKKESFLHQELVFKDGYVAYKGFRAKYIVFAEGYGLAKNPFFNTLPLQGSKGEYLIIKSKELKETNAIKSSIFIIPLGNDLYKVGANYNRADKSNDPTDTAKKELVEKLEKVLTCDYVIVGHVAGVRPTVKDRRPLVGRHPLHPRLHILNGFGSHGILIGPWAATGLYDYIEKGTPLNKEMDIQRFH